MKLLDLSCNHCGAQLDVPRKVRFLTCSFCGTQLKVEQSGGAVYTEALEEIAQDIKELKRDAAVERIDREWQMQREGLVTRGQHGETSVPSRGGAVFSAIVVIGFGLFWMSMAGGIFGGGIAGFGLIFILVGVVAAASSWRSAGTYENAHAEYEQKRRELMGDENDATA